MGNWLEQNNWTDLTLSLKIPLNGHIPYISQSFQATNKPAWQLQESSFQCSKCFHSVFHSVFILGSKTIFFFNPVLPKRPEALHVNSPQLLISRAQQKMSKGLILMYSSSPQLTCCWIWMEISRDARGDLCLEHSAGAGMYFDKHWYQCSSHS